MKICYKHTNPPFKSGVLHEDNEPCPNCEYEKDFDKMIGNGNAFRELNNALYNLFIEVIKSLKIDKLVEWLNKKLSKGGKQND